MGGSSWDSFCTALKPVKVLAVQTFRRGRASLEAEIFLQVDLKLSVRVQHF